MKQDYLPLPIKTRTDDMGFEVYNAVYQAWQKSQDKKLSAKERGTAKAYIKRLWAAARLARRGPRARVQNQLVAYTYDAMLPLAREALGEYRDVEHISKSEGASISKARNEAKDAAIRVILERLVPDRRPMKSEGSTAYQAAFEKLTHKRKAFRAIMEKWKWLDRRSDGLAKELTALDLGIKPSSVHVLRFRAKR